MKGSLTPKQLLFCEEYVLDRRGGAAAERAGYSKASAAQQATRLLRKVQVSSKIAELLNNSTAKAEIRLDEVIAELKSIAFATMAEFANWTAESVSLVPKSELSEGVLKAIESLGETTDAKGNRRVKIKLHSKISALEALIRCFELIQLERTVAEIEETLSRKEANNGKH